jgi:hypothetical protein
VLRRQAGALAAESRASYLKTWDLSSRDSRQRASSIYANLESLRTVIGGLHLAGGPTTSAAPQPLLARPTLWDSDVAVRWRLRGSTAREAHAVLAVTFVRRGHAVYVADMATAAGHRRPVWLVRHLEVRRTSRTLAAATSPDQVDRLHRLLAVATTDINRVLPRWHGDLVAYEPGSAAAFDELLAATPGTYDGIAAVTATVDGSTGPRAPVAIFVNPASFDPLSQIGAHVVITHEATHAATGAAVVGLPLWVAEGFADYVALGSVDVPLTVSARAAILDVRRHGVPRALPSDSAFATTGPDLEVVYEQAWLAARLIARTFGEARLVDFYTRIVATSGHVAMAVRTQLGTSLAQLTDRWRRSLRTLARGA